jgi:hypothetical protein
MFAVHSEARRLCLPVGRLFEVTFPPGPLNIDIGERYKMCVVHQIRNSDEDFPLCVNDIIVSVNDIPMAKLEGDTESVETFLERLGVWDAF